jgi:hypothetical protein
MADKDSEIFVIVCNSWEHLRFHFYWYRYMFYKNVDSLSRVIFGCLQDCAAKFPVAVGLVNVDRPTAQDKFVLAAPATSPPDQLRVLVALSGDSITQVSRGHH